MHSTTRYSTPARIAFAALASLAVLAPSSASADGTPLGLRAAKLDVAMTADGAAHVARLTTEAGTPTLSVCRIPAGDRTCIPTGSAALPHDAVTGPFVVARGSQVTAVAGSSDGAEEGTWAMTAPAGAAYGPLSRVSAITAADVELSPAGDRLWIGAAHGPTGSANDFAAFSSAPLAGGTPAGAAVLGSAPGSRSVSGHQVGVRPDGRPLAFLSGSAPGLTTTGERYFAAGAAAPIDTTLNDAGTWGAATRFDLPQPSAQNGDYEVASAPGRLWLAYQGLGTDVLLRRWEGEGFGPALSPDCRRRSRFTSGTQAAPALAVSRRGDLLLAYVGSDGTRKHLGYVRGTPDGGRFSAYTELHTGPDDQEDVEIASDPTSDTGGIVVWTSDAIYEDKGELRFARLPEPPLTLCPAPRLSELVGGLTATKRCAAPRSLALRLRQPAATRLVSATVKVNGRTVASRKGAEVAGPLRLAKLPKGGYVVRFTLRLADGRTVRGTRRYGGCARGR